MWLSSPCRFHFSSVYCWCERCGIRPRETILCCVSPSNSTPFPDNAPVFPHFLSVLLFSKSLVVACLGYLTLAAVSHIGGYIFLPRPSIIPYYQFLNVIPPYNNTTMTTQHTKNLEESGGTLGIPYQELNVHSHLRIFHCDRFPPPHNTFLLRLVFGSSEECITESIFRTGAMLKRTATRCHPLRHTCILPGGSKPIYYSKLKF